MDTIDRILEQKNEQIKQLEQENRRLSEKNKIYSNALVQEKEEKKKLKEFKERREESMFYFKALAERVEPINSKEAEDLQKYKKLFEKLYREELSCLEEENKNLKESLDIATKCSSKEEDGIIRLSEENKKLKEEIEFLEQCLDNKEKVNKSLREDLEWYRGFDNYLTNHGFDMKNLKSELFKKNQN